MNGIVYSSARFQTPRIHPKHRPSVVKPRLRWSPAMECWECIGPSFDGNPTWVGHRRSLCPYEAYEDWKAMYTAYATIYRVKGLKVPVA